MADTVSIRFDSRPAVAALARALPKVEREVVKETSTTAIIVQSIAKQLAPVDTGRLRSSIQIERFEGGLIQSVGSNVEYAKHVEFGTDDQLSQPFLGPALEKSLGDHQARLKRAVQRGLLPG